MTEPSPPAPPLADRPPAAGPADPGPDRTGRDRAGGGPPRAAQPVVPLHRPGRWLAAALVLIVLAQCAHGLVTNPFFQWDRFGYWFLRPVILDGLVVTLQVTAWSAVLGLLGGVALALMRLSGNPVLQSVSWVYVWLFRSIPLIVLLVFLFNFGALYRTISVGVPFGPAFLQFDQADLATSMVIAVVGLSLNESAFAAEVVRSGILSVDQGQHEAAAALGLPKRYQFRRIVLPQALRTIVPSYVNLLIGLVKATSLVYYVSLLDLFGSVATMSATYPGDVVPLLMVATVWYLILTSVISVVQYYVERHYARGAVRTLPPTPLQRLRAAARRARPLGALR